MSYEASRKEDKDSFYKKLEAVSQYDDSDDEGILEAERFLKLAKAPKVADKRAKKATKAPSVLGSISFDATTRSVTNPEAPSSSNASGALRRVNSLPEPKDKRRKRLIDQPPSLVSSKSAPPAVETMTRGRPVTKKQKFCHVPEVPEHLKVFKDLDFFFLPNNKINAFRAARIGKVQQYGGNWVENWEGPVDFIVLDDNLTYQDLLKWLKVEALPKNKGIVYAKFISDSLDLKILMDPDQPCYRVRGAPKIEMVIEIVDEDIPSSLPVKPDSKAREYRTPSPEVTITPLLESNHASYDDALSKMIEQAKEVNHLPLEEDSGDDPIPDTKANVPAEPTDQEAYKNQRRLNWQKSFSCMQKNERKAENTGPNATTIDILEQMGRYYDRMNDEWRVIAYRKAVSILKKQTKRIVTKEEAYILPGVGPRLAQKIEEIALTNRLQRLDNALEDPTDAVLQKFTQIYGVGIKLALKWVKQGYRSFHDLKEHVTLTPSQKIGIARYDDFLRRIPRAEVEEHGNYVRQVLKELDSSYQMKIVGSYHRGAESSGDIDIIITKEDANQHTISNMVFNSLISTLTKKGFLKASLATAHVGDEADKWHGCSCLPNSTVWRRMDFLVVPWDEMGAALIYFTGNDLFNRSIRLLASKKGMRLNQRGLFKNVMRARNREKMTDGELVESRSEKKIFEILGVPWRRPEERNV